MGHVARIDRKPGTELPCTTRDVLAVGTLSGALTHLVFDHPHMRALRAKAKTVARDQACLFDEFAGLVKPVYGHDEALLPLKYIRTDIDEALDPDRPPDQDEDTTSEFAELLKRAMPPPEVCAYYAAVNLRARAVVGPLQSRKVVGIGHAEDGHLVTIAHSIWSHEAYYVHPWIGDVYEARSELMIKKWTGVILSDPTELSLSALFHVKPTAFGGLPPITTEPSKRRSRKGIARVEANIKDATECRQWLVGLMRKSLNERIINRVLWPEAKKKWPKLSKNAFFKARADAIEETDAVEWAAGGAPKKLPNL